MNYGKPNKGYLSVGTGNSKGIYYLSWFRL